MAEGLSLENRVTNPFCPVCMPASVVGHQPVRKARLVARSHPFTQRGTGGGREGKKCAVPWGRKGRRETVGRVARRRGCFSGVPRSYRHKRGDIQRGDQSVSQWREVGRSIIPDGGELRYLFVCIELGFLSCFRGVRRHYGGVDPCLVFFKSRMSIGLYRATIQ